MTKYIEIKDFDDPQLDVYARLSEGQLLNRHEPEKGLFIAESLLVIQRAINAGYEPVSFLVEDGHTIREAGDLLASYTQIPIYIAKLEVLTKLTGYHLTRGILCAMKRKVLPKAEDICHGARRIAVLENVVNPTNVGAIFRSAAALNMDAVLLTPFCSNPLYRRSIRVSMGTVFQIPWTFLQAEDISVRLQSLGFKTVAMALNEKAIRIDDERLAAEKKLAIVLGTEGNGLCETTISSCDYTVQIPMSHGVDSLNVAAASAVAFWQLGK